MPVQLSDYKVQAPDGSIVQFRGPTGMTDDHKILRAQQEYKIQTGDIQTTFAGGAQQSLGDTLAAHGSDLGTALALGGAVTAQPEVVAASPFVGRGLKAAGQYIAGRKIETPTPGEVAGLAAESVVGGYAPEAAGWLAKSTVPHLSPISGNFVKGVAGSGLPAWAGRTIGEAANVFTGPKSRVAAYMIPDQIRQYLMDKLNGQGSGH